MVLREYLNRTNQATSRVSLISKCSFSIKQICKHIVRLWECKCESFSWSNCYIKIYGIYASSDILNRSCCSMIASSNNFNLFYENKMKYEVKQILFGGRKEITYIYSVFMYDGDFFWWNILVVRWNHFTRAG